MAGALNALLASGAPSLTRVIGTNQGRISTYSVPAGTQVGDLAVFANANSDGGGDTPPPGFGWSNGSSGNNIIGMYWKILTSSDLSATKTISGQWSLAVYRGPVNAGFRSQSGFTRSPYYAALVVCLGNVNNSGPGPSPNGCPFNNRVGWNDGGAPNPGLWDNFPPLSSYQSGGAINGGNYSVVLELLSQ